MAKKKHKKKHSFQHKNAPSVVTAVETPAVKGATMPNEWSEVSSDVKKTLIFGAVFILLMFGLWLLFEFTSVGPNLYNSIKL